MQCKRLCKFRAPILLLCYSTLKRRTERSVHGYKTRVHVKTRGFSRQNPPHFLCSNQQSMLPPYLTTNVFASAIFFFFSLLKFYRRSDMSRMNLTPMADIFVKTASRWAVQLARQFQKNDALLPASWLPSAAEHVNWQRNLLIMGNFICLEKSHNYYFLPPSIKARSTERRSSGTAHAWKSLSSTTSLSMTCHWICAA